MRILLMLSLIIRPGYSRSPHYLPRAYLPTYLPTYLVVIPAPFISAVNSVKFVLRDFEFGEGQSQILEWPTTLCFDLVATEITA